MRADGAPIIDKFSLLLYLSEENVRPDVGFVHDYPLRSLFSFLGNREFNSRIESLLSARQRTVLSDFIRNAFYFFEFHDLGESAEIVPELLHFAERLVAKPAEDCRSGLS